MIRRLSQVLLACAALGAVQMMNLALAADDDSFIPNTLSKEKQDNLRRFFIERRARSSAFVPEGAKLMTWANIDTPLTLPPRGAKVEKEYLAEVALERAKALGQGPNN